VVPEVVTENHSTVTDPVTEDKDNVVSLVFSSFSNSSGCASNRKCLQQQKSAAEPWIMLQACCSRHAGAETAAQWSHLGGRGQASENAGEMNPEYGDGTA
jgi:hypothetical protein